MNLSPHVHTVFSMFALPLFRFWSCQDLQNITVFLLLLLFSFFFTICVLLILEIQVNFQRFPSLQSNQNKTKQDKGNIPDKSLVRKRNIREKGSDYHNSLDWLRKWNISWNEGEKVTKTHVRYTAEIYLLTTDFSVSSCFSGWSQKLLVGPPNSSSVVTL